MRASESELRRTYIDIVYLLCFACLREDFPPSLVSDEHNAQQDICIQRVYNHGVSPLYERSETALRHTDVDLLRDNQRSDPGQDCTWKSTTGYQPPLKHRISRDRVAPVIPHTAPFARVPNEGVLS